eukprot:XP_002266609.2 PREDICTED: probable xyloglucan endotransglucosylase/hydrolase protein 28 [Vitis vinifera]
MRINEILTGQTTPRKMAKSLFICSILLLLNSFLSFRSSATNLAYSTPFDRWFFKVFGDENIKSVHNGTVAKISLDQKTGSEFVSSDIFLHGYFSASIKLPRNQDTAGVVVAFFTMNQDIYSRNQDEATFEFLGNVKGKEWVVQTNIHGNTTIRNSTSKGREERYTLWFDPSADFHKYSILWTENHIIFYVDDVPIRLFMRTKAIGNYFITSPMYVYGSIRDGSDWATDGGKQKVDYKYAPFTAAFSELILLGCPADPIDLKPYCIDEDPWEKKVPTGLTRKEITQMRRFRHKFMTYSYCFDKERYPVTPPECFVDGREMEPPQNFDPVVFGGDPVEK